MVGLTNKLAECAGLWLAEGDRKSISEITFTNNSFELINFFFENTLNIFGRNNFRLYVYKPSKKYRPKFNFDRFRIVKFYVDKRANRPYFILRFADRLAVKKWRAVVSSVLKEKKFYKSILRGFFAGEGNIKTGSHHNRTIRIAQKEPMPIIDSILNFFGISFKFFERERAYVVTGRGNWEKFAKMCLADLHPEKGKRFWEVYESFREWHYPKNHIRNNILNYLGEPKTSSELAEVFRRDISRIQRVLSVMKREGKVKNFRAGSINYWISSRRKVIIISKRKAKILNLLDSSKKTSDISQALNINWKAANRRLLELKRLGLVKNENYLWYKVLMKEEVKVL